MLLCKTVLIVLPPIFSIVIHIFLFHYSQPNIVANNTNSFQAIKEYHRATMTTLWVTIEFQLFFGTYLYNVLNCY